MSTLPDCEKPTLLVSYAFLKEDCRPLPGDGFRDWLMDSGAYSALNTGVAIDLHRYTADVVRLQAEDPRLVGVFALDVIGDPEKSMANAEHMERNGARVIPTWHAGSDVSYLKDMCKKWKRCAVGGLVQRMRNNRGLKMDAEERTDWIAKAFAAAWPHWLHGFGCSGDALLDSFPFASVDSTTWRLRPSMYGAWKRFGGYLPVRLKAHHVHLLKTEALFFCEREDWLTARWAKELALVGAERMSVRLASQPQDLPWFSKHFGNDVLHEHATDDPNEELPEVKAAKRKSAEMSGEDYPAEWQDYWAKRLGTMETRRPA